MCHKGVFVLCYLKKERLILAEEMRAIDKHRKPEHRSGAVLLKG